MTRKTPLRPLMGATAVAAALAACSQPPGAALVDLSGTYGQTASYTPNLTAAPVPYASLDLGGATTAYQPNVVYQSTPVTQSPVPFSVAQDVGLTYQDAPVSQVVSLDSGIGYTSPDLAPRYEPEPQYEVVEQAPQYTSDDLAPGYYAGAPEPINLGHDQGSPRTYSAIEAEPLATIDVAEYTPPHAPVSDYTPIPTALYSEPVPQSVPTPQYSAPAPGYAVDFSHQGQPTAYGATPFQGAAAPLEPQRVPYAPAPAYQPLVPVAAAPVYDGGTAWGAPQGYTPPAPQPQAPAASTRYPLPYAIPGYGTFPPEGYLGDAVSALRASTFTAASYRTGPPVPQQRHAIPAQPPQRYVAASAPSYTPANAPGYGAAYVIRHGDTLYSIARRHGLKVDQIAAANNMGLAATIYPGQTIVLPGATVAIAPAPAAAPPAQQQPMTVAYAPQNTVTYGEPAPQVVYQNVTAPVAFETGSIGGTAQPSFRWPVHGQVYARKDAHGAVGLEIRANPGLAVAASEAGEVRHVQDGAQGILVVIDHDGGWRSLYLGLDNVGVQPGQPIAAGAPIGVIAAKQTASVLFELRKNGVAIDPISQLKN